MSCRKTQKGNGERTEPSVPTAEEEKLSLAFPPPLSPTEIIRYTQRSQAAGQTVVIGPLQVVDVC